MNKLDFEKTIRGIIGHVGDDVLREGLRDTPERVYMAYRHLFSGYETNLSDVITVFENTSGQNLVYLRDIEFFSTCEHHLMPFFGKAHIGYIPGKYVIGISKLARILDCYARRLQIQERIAEQVVDCLMEHLDPIGAICVIEAKHLCIACRGVAKQHSVMGVSAVRGVFADNMAARQEFLTLIKG